jgi:hypothetical protein
MDLRFCFFLILLWRLNRSLSQLLAFCGEVIDELVGLTIEAMFCVIGKEQGDHSKHL